MRCWRLLKDAGIEAQGDPVRPLDHGTWVPLMHLFPTPTCPWCRWRCRCAGARARCTGWAPRCVAAQSGVLVIGSGSMTHNLGEFFGGEREPAPYVLEFSRWIESAVVRGDLPALLDYRERAPHAARAHPSEDHFLPLFFALGAAGEGGQPEYISREVMYGMLAMDAFALQAPIEPISERKHHQVPTHA